MQNIKGNFRGIVTSDEHAPYHDLKALALVNKVAAWWKPNLWLLNGDQLDCADLSTFIKDEDVICFQDEIDIWHSEILGPQLEAAPDAKFIKIDGNHERRFPKYVSKSDGIKNLRAIEIRNVLELDKLGIRHCPNGVIINGQILVTHGDFAFKWAGTSVRAQMEDSRYRYHVIIGHSHRQGRVPIRVGDGWIIGQENPCLCNLSPAYLSKKPDWSLGFSLMLSTAERSHIIPVSILPDYSCYVGDKLFELAVDDTEAF